MILARAFPLPAVAALFTVCPLMALGGEPEGSGSEEIHRHHFAVLAGGSHNTEKNGATMGADYEYRFHHRLGVLASLEYAGGDFREDVYILTAAWHPWKGLRLLAGPGFDRELERKEETGRLPETEHHSKYRGLFRTGASWEFHLKEHFTIGPEIAVDILKGEKVFVYGINFGWGFGRR